MRARIKMSLLLYGDSLLPSLAPFRSFSSLPTPPPLPVGVGGLRGSIDGQPMGGE